MEHQMYKQILVAVDGSGTSSLALKEAINLAKDQHASLRLVHALDLGQAYSEARSSDAPAYQQALEATSRKVIEDCSAVVRDAGVQFDAKMPAVDRRGQHVCDVIDAEAKQWPADLVVIGTHGRRGIPRLFLGSVAEGLARISSKPLLLVRSE